MGFFTKPVTVSETVPQQSHLQYTEEQLAKVSIAYHEAEERFNEACVAVTAYEKKHFDTRFSIQRDGVTVKTNALINPIYAERRALERTRALALRKRDELLHERADLLKGLGKIR
jgi:hypothetical protein